MWLWNKINPPIADLFSRGAHASICPARHHWKARNDIFDQFQSECKSRVIAFIDRQENPRIFGAQVSTYIDIEDSEAELRAIRLTPDNQPYCIVSNILCRNRFDADRLHITRRRYSFSKLFNFRQNLSRGRYITVKT